jgi:alcohol dehydrogenase (cytochrome c)
MRRAGAIFLLVAAVAQGQVPFERLLKSDQEPQNWLTYHGSYTGRHYTSLTQVNPGSVKDLELKWVWQAQALDKFQATPLVVDGVMYLTEPPGTALAIDARTGRTFWMYEHKLPPDITPCCGKVNRGLAILGNTLYMGTLDARLLALDAATGRKQWDVQIAPYRTGYSLTHAPLVVKDMVIVGPAGGELGIQGFIAAYAADTGKELWRFHAIPKPGEPGHETWKNDAWKTGGASIWLTGSYDPEANLTYWGVGNPGPDWDPEARPGDNLYSSSVVALDANTGKKRWHFQFTPHDEWDWDSVQTPVLADMEWKGRQRKVMLWGNRNGFFYVLDRLTGEFLLGKPFVKQTWASGLDERGRPMKIPGMGPSAKGTEVWPGVQGGTNWYAPSYSPNTKLFYVTGWEDYHSTYYTWHTEYVPGKWFSGGTTKAVVPPTRREQIHRWGKDGGYAAVMAIDPRTGEKAWQFPMTNMSESGLLTTASDLLFSGNREGHFFALDAKSGKLLWRTYLGGQVMSSPVSYQVDGRQYVTIIAGHSVFTFGLR